LIKYDGGEKKVQVINEDETLLG